jgi:hypothetical protein
MTSPAVVSLEHLETSRVWNANCSCLLATALLAVQEQGTAGQMWIEVRIARMYEEAKEDLELGGWTD